MGISIKYVVTDPCYILDNDVWSKCCEVFDKYKDDEFMYQRFEEAVSKALVEYTGYPAFACGTGFGDWKNKLSGIGVIKSDFFADAGMVCVCRLTPKMLKHWKEKYGTQAFSGMAIFEASKNISVEFDVSDKNWTVVNIKDNKTQAIISSMDSDFYEEDNEDDYFEEEDYE